MDDFVIQTFPRKAKLKFELEQKLWNSIFNSTVKVQDCRHGCKGVSGYTYTMELLIRHPQTESNLKYREGWGSDGYLPGVPGCSTQTEIRIYGRPQTAKDPQVISAQW